jgi:hypothetical protein
MTREQEQERIKTLFDQLVSAPLNDFPDRYTKFDAPPELGVYVIFSPLLEVLYVGRTTRTQYPGVSGGGLRRRLKTQRQKIGFEPGSKFRYLIVIDARERALLEAYAIGFLCPKHLGLGDKDIQPRTD